MMAELRLIWQDLRGLPPDPLLTLEENKELRSQTYTKVLCICEELYLHYLQQLKMLGKRTVFSHHVNRSRLAAQMAMDLSSLLNAHSIHRSVAMGIKAMRGDVKLRDEQEKPPQMHTKVVPQRLDICPHIKPKKQMASRQQKWTMEKDLKESQEQIGELDLEKVYDLMPFHQELISSKVEKHSSPATVPTKLEEDHCLFQRHVTRLKGCSSMPDLQRETLLEELDVASLPTRPLSPVILLSADHCYGLNNEIDPAEHLRRLLLTDSIGESTVADFPLLIGASTSRGSNRLEEMKNRLQRLEEKEELKEKKVKTHLETARPQYPQAAVESVSVSTLGIARMAAARVTDRVLHETININMYPPVYNDITEIETSSDALLDQNLFNGTELRDTYKVLSENLSSEYFNFEDPMMEPALRSVKVLHGLKHKHLKKLMNLNYISSQESDDEEDENEKIKREQMRKQQEKIDALKRQKEAYQPGFWNANTVLMGGLWKEPVPDEAEETDEGIQHMGPEVPVAKSEEEEQIQSRLERIWTILCLPEMQRLDMAIKYSTRAHRGALEEAIAAWEQAAQLIQQRECLLSQLEMFERVASDPSRFFQTGHHGSSAARMTEAKHREKLECQIAAVDKVLSKSVHHISETFNDTVTYKGRPYKEKMRWDRTEMLYWLQQERRFQALKKLLEGKGSLPARLPPLQPTSD